MHPRNAIAQAMLLLLLLPAAANAAAGDIVIVTDSSLLEVDPATGDRTVITSDAVGSGQPLLDAEGVGKEADDKLVVIDSELNSVVRVDPTTGDRTILSTVDQTAMCTNLTPLCTEAGLPFACCTGLQMSDGTPPCEGPFACCTGQGTGNGSPPCSSVGTGPAFIAPTGISVDDTGDILVSDAGLEAVVRVDPVSGDRSILASASVGSGPISGLRRILVLPGGFGPFAPAMPFVGLAATAVALAATGAVFLRAGRRR